MLRYYPSSRIQTNQNTAGGDFTLNGAPYVGKYYVAYDGTAFTGPDPLQGPSEPLKPVLDTKASSVLSNPALPQSLQQALIAATLDRSSVSSKKSTQQQNSPINLGGGPVPYYPSPISDDYGRGYLIRYFAKKTNDRGYVIEISPEEYTNIQNGTAPYDISMYMTGQMMWKLTGPLNAVRISQYDTRAGIIDTNKRLTEELNKTMIGMTDFIGGQYSKWARPTT